MKFKLNSALVCAIALVYLVTGCSVVGTRWFQAKVPTGVSKPPEQTEHERQSADLLSREIQTPAVLKPVAVALSKSLGAPVKPLPASTPEELTHSAGVATALTQADLVAMQKQIENLNKSLLKYQGKEIEGTGFSILGPGVVTIVIGLAVLGCVFPPVFTILAFAYRRVKATAKIVVDSIESSAQDPELQTAVSKIKNEVSQKMTAHPFSTDVLKNVVLDLKKA